MVRVGKAISRPEKIPPYLLNQYLLPLSKTAKWETYRRLRFLPHQSNLIHKFIDQKEFVLIILDACRYDVFSQLHSRHISGDLRKAWAAGRWTAEYVSRTWTENYDLTYFSAMPVISDFYFDTMDLEYRPNDHIEEVIGVWESMWDADLGTVPPECVTDTALNHIADSESTRAVVHYAQPHAPYIGDTEILPWDGSTKVDMRERLREDIDRPNQIIYERIRNGEVSDAALRKAYEDNLKRVLPEGARLIQRVNCPVVVTSDHGEHLGEEDRYLHEEDSFLIRQIPWLVVNEREIGQTSIEDEYRELDLANGEGVTEDELDERLTALGYK